MAGILLPAAYRNKDYPIYEDIFDLKIHKVREYLSSKILLPTF